jgi:redox-sensing transcriptional repressor
LIVIKLTCQNKEKWIYLDKIISIKKYRMSVAMQEQSPKIAALPTIRRLPLYLRILHELKEKGDLLVSGTYLAERMQCEPIQVRKDLAVTGSEGRPRLGFEIRKTIMAIEDFLGWNNIRDAFLVGVGSLGSALLGYQAFAQHNLNIVAAFDSNPEKIGLTIHEHEIFSVDKMETLAQRLHVKIGILTVPALAAKATADFMVQCGIKAIWNFTPINLQMMPNVIVQNEDLSAGLAVLSRRLQAMQNKE